MVNNKGFNKNYNKLDISEDVLHWSSTKEKALNVVSVPFSSSDIFLNTILRYATNGSKILYITGEDEKYIEIINCIKRYSSFRDYSYFRGNHIDENTALVISSHKSAMEIEEKFDLVIYDDIKSFPMYDNYEILDLVMKCVKDEGKIISYSIESIFKQCREILIPVNESKLPIIEPRIITTRVDINKDIPYVVYDYLNWSIDSNRNVIIYVPNSEKAYNVYKYLLTYRKNLGKNVVCVTLDHKDDKILSNFMRAKNGIIITDCFQEFYLGLKNIDIMVYFADDKIFDYKKLVHFCGKVGRGEVLSRGEVIFLSSEETEQMEKAKSITRNFNKEAWELGLLNI